MNACLYSKFNKPCSQKLSAFPLLSLCQSFTPAVSTAVHTCEGTSVTAALRCRTRAAMETDHQVVRRSANFQHSFSLRSGVSRAVIAHSRLMSRCRSANFGAAQRLRQQIGEHLLRAHVLRLHHAALSEVADELQTHVNVLRLQR